MPKILLFHVAEPKNLVFSVIEVPPFRPSFRDGSNLMRNHELYERSIYERTILSEPSIENYAISNELSIELSNKSVKPIHEHRQVSRRDQEPSRIPLQTVERLKNKSREITDVLVHVYPNRLNFIGV